MERDPLYESGAAIVGGHSIENKEPIFGMSVIGQVNQINLENKGLAGDVLITAELVQDCE